MGFVLFSSILDVELPSLALAVTGEKRAEQWG
jgi:hypothetical protein